MHLTNVPVESVGAVLNAVRSVGFDLEVRLRAVTPVSIPKEALVVIDSMPPEREA